jgi:hypothetical protein
LPFSFALALSKSRFRGVLMLGVLLCGAGGCKRCPRKRNATNLVCLSHCPTACVG